MLLLALSRQPRSSSCPTGFSPQLDRLFDAQGDALILGDFNAHSPAWYSQTSDSRAAARGDYILDALTDSNLVLLNSDAPTRLPSHGLPSSPDLTISTPHIALDFDWSPHTTLNSDHLPIIISLRGCFSTTVVEPPHITFSNIRKADWISFTREAEEAFARLGEEPSSCSAGEIQFRRILLTADKHHVPKGHVPHFIPNLPDSTKRLINERDSLRTSLPTDPHIHTLELQITKDISESSRKSWIDTLESCSHKHNMSHFWKTIEQLSQKQTHIAPNQPITFTSGTTTKTLTNNKAIATAFAKQFTTIVPLTPDPQARRVKRYLNRTHPLDTHITPFTIDTVQEAIRLSGNSRAVGPDGLTIHHLKHLGPLGIQYLTLLFNLSYQHANIPPIWKSATIVPVLKPGKPSGSGPGYRPISLLCPSAKVLERESTVYSREGRS